MLKAHINAAASFPLTFKSDPWGNTPEDNLPSKETVDFEKEPGKVRS